MMALNWAEPPFLALVGNRANVPVVDVALEVPAYYHVLSRRGDIHRALAAMKAASDNDDFTLIDGTATHENFLRVFEGLQRLARPGGTF